MICTNELSQQRCRNAELLRTMVVLIAPFAPHIAEELWERMGGEGSVCDAQWPEWNEEYLVEDEVQLSVTFNGKKRFDMTFALSLPMPHRTTYRKLSWPTSAQPATPTASRSLRSL